MRAPWGERESAPRVRVVLGCASYDCVRRVRPGGACVTQAHPALAAIIMCPLRAPRSSLFPSQVLIRRAAVSELLALHRKVNDKETIVGW